MPKALLLWDIPQNFPNSMDRYAGYLSEYLPEVSKNSNWSFHNLVPNPFGADNQFINWVLNKNTRLPDLFTRFISYPIRASTNSADLYHIIDHGYGQLAYLLRNRNLVVTCHDLMTLRFGEGSVPGATVSRSSLRKFRWIVSGLRYAKAIIADSYCTKKEIIKFLGISEKKIHVVYLGVEDKFSPIYNRTKLSGLRQSFDIPLDSKIVLHVTGTTPYKNIEGLLRTLAIINYELKIQSYLLRIGMPLTCEQWDLARNLGIDSYIREAGHLSDQVLIKAYNLADVFLFPSWWEGFGLPPLEAMACGTPVVLSNRASLPEVVGDAGVIASPDDYAGMALAIKRIFEDKAWRDELITKGFTRAAQFTWEKTIKDTFAVYENVLNKTI